MAFNEGNSAAYQELGWFRVADNGDPHEWLAAGRGQNDRILTVGTPPVLGGMDLEKPLMRWRRNYIVMLKMAEIELDTRLAAIQKVEALLEWMRDEFILAGPAATLAFLYFAPHSPPRKGLLKGLQSADRQVALAGVKNAAWDITYLSDFAQRINGRVEGPPRRYIFSTFDKRLRDIARFVVGVHEEVGADGNLAKPYEEWWTSKDAKGIADLWHSCIQRTRAPDWWDQYKGRPDYVSELITQGEAFLLNWKHKKRPS